MYKPPPDATSTNFVFTVDANCRNQYDLAHNPECIILFKSSTSTKSLRSQTTDANITETLAWTLSWVAYVSFTAF